MKRRTPEELFRSARSLRGDEGRVRAWRETLLSELAVRSIPHAVASHGMAAAPGLLILLKPMIAVFLVVVLLFGGGGAAVAAAQNDLPGDALYGVKITTERVQEAFALSSEKKVDVKSRFAARRAEEIEALAKNQETLDEAAVSEAAGRVEEYMQDIKEALAELPPETVSRIAAALGASLDQSQSRLEAVRVRLSSSTQADIDEAMEATREVESEIDDDDEDVEDADAEEASESETDDDSNDEAADDGGSEDDEASESGSEGSELR